MAYRIIIVGGGISGLAAAHRLTELGRERGLPLAITLLEAQHRFGGVIETQLHEGCLLESGPDAFIAEKPWALELCRRLGLSNDIIETRPGFRRSFIVRRGRLVQVPEGLYLLAPARVRTLWNSSLLSWPGKVRMAGELFIPPRRQEGDESVGSFVRRRFGQEALDRIGQPMIGGIYTANPERLSLQATLPRFQEMERQHGGVIKGLRVEGRRTRATTAAASGPRYSLFVTLRSGLGTLVQELIQRLMSEVRLRHSARVASISQGRRWTVTLEDGETLEADALCLALPAHQTASLLASCAPTATQLLEEIPYESVATVHLVFRREEIPHPLNGFGFVVPAVERRRLVGCTFASVKFPDRAPESLVLLRAFVGGALHRSVFGLEDDALERMVRQELRELLGVQAAPSFVAIHRHPQAMPQYQVGHLARITAIEEAVAGHPGLYLTGNGYRGIGIPDCIHQAEQTAERMLAEAAQTPGQWRLDGEVAQPAGDTP